MECPQKNGDGVEWIVAYAARTLDPDSEIAFESHLKFCVACRTEAAAQTAVWAALDDLTHAPVSPDFDARLYQRIAQEQRLTWWRRLARADWSWWTATPVAAGAVLIAALLVKTTGPSAPPSQPLQPKLQIEQVESALDDMDILKQVGVEAAADKATPREQI